MNTPEPVPLWFAFQSINRFRRAIRKFKDQAIPEKDMLEILGEALLAPSSGNLQPYQLHWIRDPALKKSVAVACNKQKAASSAQELVVIVASPAIARQTVADQLGYIENSLALEFSTKNYYRKQMGMFKRLLGIGASALWTPFLSATAFFLPTLSLLPIGHLGSRHWAARNAIFAAEMLLLSAAAKGIDSCPMEGFSAPHIARLLNLPRNSVVPLVIGLGYRSEDARVEPRWRRSIDKAVIQH